MSADECGDVVVWHGVNQTPHRVARPQIVMWCDMAVTLTCPCCPHPATPAIHCSGQPITPQAPYCHCHHNNSQMQHTVWRSLESGVWLPRWL